MKHLCILTSQGSSEPIVYVSICDYASENKKEFTNDLKNVTCQSCLERVPSLKIDESL